MNFIKTDYCSEGETILYCPVCKNEYIHLVSFSLEEDERLNISLEFECEERYNFSSYLHNHKGYMISAITKSWLVNQDCLQQTI